MTVISSGNAWAVGDSGNSAAAEKLLILDWNGHRWQRTAAPAPGGGALLNAVAASSAGNVWAVGRSGVGAASEVLALHCC